MNIIFLQLIHHFLGLRKNELTEPKGKARRNRGSCESFQKESFHILAPECEGYREKKSATSFLSALLAWSFSFIVSSLLMMWLQMCVSPFSFTLFIWVLSNLTLSCLYSSSHEILKCVLLILWFRYFYNLFFLFSF